MGLLGVAMVTGLIFAKFARPKPRISFSRSAVITVRDEMQSLIFRTGNERANTIIDAHMKALLTHLETTPEGEPVRRFVPLELQRPTTPMFVLTWQGTHAIDESSPLYGMDAAEMAESDAEILVTVSGIDQDLAHPMQAAQTYKLREVHHGCRLADMFATDADGTRLMDFQKFHEFKVD
jgi:inward rectifier potassium channel